MNFNMITKKILLSLIVGLLALNLLHAQSDITVQASQAVYLGKTLPMGEITNLTTNGNIKKDEKKKNWPKEVGNFKGNTLMQNINPNALPLNGDPIRQYATLTSQGEQLELIVDRDGVNIGQSGSVPPDPVGAIGKNHYVQMVNGLCYSLFLIQMIQRVNIPPIKSMHLDYQIIQKSASGLAVIM